MKGESAISSYQERILRLDEDLATQQDRMQALEAKIDDLNVKLNDEKNARTGEVSRLKEEIKGIKEILERQSKIISEMQNKVKPEGISRSYSFLNSTSITIRIYHWESRTDRFNYIACNWWNHILLYLAETLKMRKLNNFHIQRII